MGAECSRVEEKRIPGLGVENGKASTVIWHALCFLRKILIKMICKGLDTLWVFILVVTILAVYN